MNRITFPKGTYESKSKGLMTSNGAEPFVHVVNDSDFYKSYPIWKSKNPRRNHVYVFNGRLHDGDSIMDILRQDMVNRAPSASSTTRRSPRRSPNNSVGSSSTRMTTRGMARQASVSASTATSRTTTPTRRRTRKQKNPRRSHFE